ncbi:MAG: flagellin [Lachnospirales bacterium]
MSMNSSKIALNIRTAMLATNASYAKNSLMLSSGVRINSVKDDATGLAIANKLKRKVNGYEKVSNNANDGISLIQTMDGALSSMNEMLEKMRTLSVQSSNGTLEDSERRKVQLEIEELTDEITELSQRTEFNGINLLDGDGKRLTYERAETGYSKLNYVSGEVPEGNLNFTIDSVGESATVAFDESTINPSAGGTVTINGSNLTFPAGSTKTDVLDAIKQACEDNNLEIDLDANTITSRVTGSAASIEITSTPAGIFGFAASTLSDTGKDAVISNVNMTNMETGDPITSFNNGISSDDVYVEGNRCYVTSTNGQKIEIDITGKGTGTQVHEIHNKGQLKIQIGTEANMDLDIYGRTLNAKALGIDNINVSTQSGAMEAIEKYDRAISSLLEQRTTLGALQNRLTFTETAIDTASLNTETAYSRIMDTDMAKTMSDLTSDNVKTQAAISILAQANQRPQQLLQLLG